MEEKNNKKRVAITVYIQADFAELITRKYAAAVLNGYNGTKQVFLNECIANGLKTLEVK